MTSAGVARPAAARCPGTGPAAAGWGCGRAVAGSRSGSCGVPQEGSPHFWAELALQV